MKDTEMIGNFKLVRIERVCYFCNGKGRHLTDGAGDPLPIPTSEIWKLEKCPECEGTGLLYESLYNVKRIITTEV